ncbi:undecaprenyl-diphosphate phosphatase [Carboxydochorda subterranea]|uniref:Undecaprenyl-diphosphatase n=1 Tax=Carboxydichorda subterranea TaxID=3109565 RepID=A0ABZ1BTR5_9FIRM|nr:undecaprenyl-diphosphate phosphatase [Limnochorda sp. L945t]WRP16043.1 undecaprenyl-diphosphate phosphatase [Limnochorda sp. L945t]
MESIVKAAVMGLVEGVTEFLPISSTGHLILAGDILRFGGPLAATFEIFIQLGAVLAVVWFYREDLSRQLRTLASDTGVRRLWFNVVVAFVPAAVVGVLLHRWIKAVLFSPVVVAVSLFAGGIALLLVERRRHAEQVHELRAVSTRQALVVGLAQTLSLVPGVSRSAASIVGGLLSGLDRTTATAFSFYLSIPTLGLATLFELATSLSGLGAGDLLLLGVGLVVAFASAFVAVGWLLRYVATHDLRPFGWYRILIGLLVLLWFER